MVDIPEWHTDIAAEIVKRPQLFSPSPRCSRWTLIYLKHFGTDIYYRGSMMRPHCLVLNLSRIQAKYPQIVNELITNKVYFMTELVIESFCMVLSLVYCIWFLLKSSSDISPIQPKVLVSIWHYQVSHRKFVGLNVSPYQQLTKMACGYFVESLAHGNKLWCY